MVEISTYPTNGNSYGGDGNPNVSYYPFKVFVSEDQQLQEGESVSISYQAVSDSDGSSLYLENMYVRTENGKSYVMARGENGKLEQRWVQDGTVWTSSGVSAGIDLKLAFIAATAGDEVAGQVQLAAEYYPEGQRYGSADLQARGPAYLRPSA